MSAPVRSQVAPAASGRSIRHAASGPPMTVPPGHVGPLALPGTGRMVWWTGRVAIGLRHQPEARSSTPSQSALWIQDLLLGSRPRLPHGA